MHEERADVDLQAARDLEEVEHGDVPLAAFDPTVVRPVETAVMREGLLRPSSLLAQRPNPRSEADEVTMPLHFAITLTKALAMRRRSISTPLIR